MLGAGSKGVFGVPGLTLGAAAAGGAEGNVITSPTRTIHLDSGTQLLLKASESGSAASEGPRTDRR
jgi:hypothetical protein